MAFEVIPLQPGSAAVPVAHEPSAFLLPR